MFLFSLNGDVCAVVLAVREDRMFSVFYKTVLRNIQCPT